MSEEKRKSRAWIWWAALAALLMMYPLSYVPFWMLVEMGWVSPVTGARADMSFYRPLLWASGKSETLHNAINWGFKAEQSVRRRAGSP